MKDKLRTTTFWLGLSGAIVLVLECLSDIIGLELYSKQVENIVLSICSILVMVGIVTKRTTKDKEEIDKEELLDDIDEEIKK